MKTGFTPGDYVVSISSANENVFEPRVCDSTIEMQTKRLKSDKVKIDKGAEVQKLSGRSGSPPRTKSQLRPKLTKRAKKKSRVNQYELRSYSIP